MSTNTHLIELERELEADLAEAQRHIELGRRNAIDEIHAHRESLGELCGEASLEIDLLASDAEQELQSIRSRLGELNLLLAVEEIRDLETFDQFRDRILQAMTDAEEDLVEFDRDGVKWVGREHRISDAWAAMSRQLGLARMHLAHEMQIAQQEFELERDELATHLGEMPRPKGRRDLVGRVGEQLGRLVPGRRTVFTHGDTTVSPEHHGARHD